MPWPAATHARRGQAHSAVAAPLPRYGWMPSPCGVQSKQAKYLLAQVCEVGIAAMARIRPVHHDIGFDAGRPVTEHDHAIGEKQRLLCIVRNEQRRKTFA